MKSSMFFAVAALIAASSAGQALAQANPSPADTERARNNPCTDPWISLAVSVAKTQGSNVGRAAGSGSSDECNPALYNDGHWNSYAELLGAVRQTRAMLASQNVEFRLVNGVPALAMINPSRGIAAANTAVLVQPGARIVAQGGGNLIGQAGGNLISQDGASIVAQGGGNIVAQGGGNIKGGYLVQGSDDAKLTFKLPSGKQIRIR